MFAPHGRPRVRLAIHLGRAACIACLFSGCIARQPVADDDEAPVAPDAGFVADAAAVGDAEAPAPIEPVEPPPACAPAWPTVVRSASVIADDWILVAGPDEQGEARVAAGRLTADGVVAMGWVDALAGQPADFSATDEGTHLHRAFADDEAVFTWFDLADPLRPEVIRAVSVGMAPAAGHPTGAAVMGSAAAFCVDQTLWIGDGRAEPEHRAAHACEVERDGLAYSDGGLVAWRHQQGNAVPAFQVFEVTTGGLELVRDLGFNPTGVSRYGDLVRGWMGAQRAVIEVENRRRQWIVTIGADRAAGTPSLTSVQIDLRDDAILGVGGRALWVAGEQVARGVDLTDPSAPAPLFEIDLGEGDAAPRLFDATDDWVVIGGRDGAVRITARAGGVPLPVRCE